MSGEDRRSRLRGRHRFAVVRHADPAEALEAAQAPDATEEVLDRPIPPADVSRETSDPVAWVPEDPPPPLSRLQVARLEALTALWERQVRVEGPADATLLYAAPRPPVPPARSSATTQTPAPESAGPGPAPAADPEPAPVLVPESAPADTATLVPGSAPGLEGPARRVAGWSSRHDPASLAYAVRDRLGRRVPLTDVLLPAGPVLDQGTAPPLDLRTASACTGMAGVAAANVLRLALAAPYTRESDVALLGVEDARAAYFRAQDLDAVHGHEYAGSSVLGVMKAGQAAGWWPTYLWALGGTSDIAQVLLQLGVAVVVGVPWTTGCEEPDAAGVIRPTGQAAGGHALAVRGLRRSAPDGRPGWWFVLRQSRGPAEGLGGDVLLHHTDLARMLAGVGEAAVPLTEHNLAGLGL